MNALQWATTHWQDILAVYGATVALATIVVKLTPSQKDDAVLSWVVKLADWFSTVNPKKPKP
jgi:hypothetical protein